MPKKYFKISAIVLGVFFLIFLVGNFGLNFWIKNKLPEYIKNKTQYNITYRSLDVNLGSGNIVATGISVSNKASRTDKVLGLEGTVDKVSVARFGLYDAIFNKEISTSSLVLNNPNLTVILPNPLNKKKKKKPNPFSMDKVLITNGNIQVYKNTLQKMVSVRNLNLDVDDLEVTPESLSQKLPVVFAHYSISGKNLFFRPDNVYAFTAQSVKTSEGSLNLKEFTMIPLLSYTNFIHFFPKKRNLFEVKSTEMEFQDIALKDDKITLKKVRFDDPLIKMYTTNVKPEQKEKSFTYDVELDDLIVANAKVEILKAGDQLLFGAKNLSMNINKLIMNEETAKGTLPFKYQDFKIKGIGIDYNSPAQKILIGFFNVNQKLIDLQNISVKPTTVSPHQTSLNLAAKKVQVKFNEWKFVENKISLDVQDILVDQLRGKIFTAKNPHKKKATFAGIHFPLKIKNVSLKNSELILESKGEPLDFHDISANFQNIEMNANTVKSGFPAQIGFYSLSTRDFKYKTKFYNLSASLLKMSKNAVQILNFAMIPTVSRAQYVRMIPTEKDLYNIKFRQLNMLGNWDLLSEKKYLNASQLTFEGLVADIFRSKIPKDDVTKKPMYSALLRSIKIPMVIQNLNLKNSHLVYEEDTKVSDGPGKLFFSNFNLSAKNINSGKMKGQPTRIPIVITCKFMDVSPLTLNWNLDTASMDDTFTIKGNIKNLPAPRLNAFIEPYLKIRATGLISDLNFNFRGYIKGIEGVVKMKHEGLKVAILKPDGENNVLLSTVANLAVKSNSGNYPASVQVDQVKRDPAKSFFNLFWRGMEEGLKLTLIGEKVLGAGENVKEAVKESKIILKAGKKDIKKITKETKNELETVQEKAKAVKENIKETKDQIKKGDVFQKIFKKKTE